VSAGGKLALTGSNDHTALLWDLETGKQLRRFVGHDREISCVQFSKNGLNVLTASSDTTLRLWKLRREKKFVNSRER
jgi:WD40 repeat protein